MRFDESSIEALSPLPPLEKGEVARQMQVWRLPVHYLVSLALTISSTFPSRDGGDCNSSEVLKIVVLSISIPTVLQTKMLSIYQR